MHVVTSSNKDISTDPLEALPPLEGFFMKHSDHRGHYEEQRVRMPPDMAGLLTHILESGLFPYKTRGDVILDSLHHWLSVRAAQMNDETLIKKLKIELGLSQHQRQKDHIQAERDLLEAWRQKLADPDYGDKLELLLEAQLYYDAMTTPSVRAGMKNLLHGYNIDLD